MVMKMNTTKTVKYILIIVFCLSSFSCKKAFQLSPENVLTPPNMYQNVNDADAALFGVMGKWIGVMDRYVVQNELRGDLMDVTQNADKYLHQLSEHAVTTDNPWADPRPYYSLIIDCNDVMNNYKIMLANKRMSQTDYDIHNAEVTAIWAWTYLQVGIHYGTVPYVTDNLANLTDLNDTSKYPFLTLDQLLDKLLAVMLAIPAANMQPIEIIGPARLTVINSNGLNLIRTIDGYNTVRMFLNRQELIGELYLWKDNYTMAAHWFRMPLEYGPIIDPTLTDVFLQFMREYPSTNGFSSTGNAWPQMFLSTFDNDDKDDILVNLPFDKAFLPGNPFVTLFSHAGKYQLKPSALAIKNWASQTRNDNGTAQGSLGSPGDIYRAAGSYTPGAEPEVKKLLGAFDPTQPFNTNGKIVLTRAGGILLHFAEAANRDGRDELATGLLNTGFNSNAFIFNGIPPVPTNVVNIKQNFDPNPDYYFDGRQGTFPVFAGPWERFTGMRQHVGLTFSTVDSTKYFDMSIKGQFQKPITNAHGLALAIEDQLVFEDALEMAYEGVRWGDLLRVARRREKEAPGTGLTFMKSHISAKFVAAGLPIPDGVNKLGASTTNWYMPFRIN